MSQPSLSSQPANEMPSGTKLPTPLLTVRANLSEDVVQTDIHEDLHALGPLVRLDVISEAIRALQQLYDRCYEEAFPERAKKLRENVRRSIASLQVGCERMVGERITSVTFTRKGELVLGFASRQQMILRGLPDRHGNNPVFGTNEELEKSLIEPMDLVYQAVGLPPPADIPMLVGTAHSG